MTLQNYMDFVQLALDDKVLVYADNKGNGAKFIGEFKGVGNGDIVAIDTLIEYLDCKTLQQIIGFTPNTLILLIEPKEC